MENPATDAIHIEQLEVFARVGVTENERAHPQRITVTLTVWPNEAFDKLQDEISLAVNYSEICFVVREFIGQRSDKLVETLVAQVASHLLAKFPLRKVEAELRKFVLPDAKYVSVIVSREARSA